MEDKNIVKALECCSSGSYGCENGCPLDKECDSPIRGGEKIMKSALDLINRQKAQIEGLQDEVVIKTDMLNSQKAEIERLKESNRILTQENFWGHKLIEQLKESAGR